MKVNLQPHVQLYTETRFISSRSRVDPYPYSKSSLTETYLRLQLYFPKSGRLSTIGERGLLKTLWKRLFSYYNTLNLLVSMFWRVTNPVTVKSSTGTLYILYYNNFVRGNFKVAPKTSLTVNIPDKFTSFFASCQILPWSPLLLNTFTPFTSTFNVPMVEPYMW